MGHFSVSSLFQSLLHERSRILSSDVKNLVKRWALISRSFSILFFLVRYKKSKAESFSSKIWLWGTISKKFKTGTLQMQTISRKNSKPPFPIIHTIPYRFFMKIVTDNAPTTQRKNAEYRWKDYFWRGTVFRFKLQLLYRSRIRTRNCGDIR